MPYEVRRSPAARQDVRKFFQYLKREAGESIARSYFRALEYDLTHLIANTPNSFNWFHETGAPYRAKLFKLARTTYWNSAREPGTHGL